MGKSRFSTALLVIIVLLTVAAVYLYNSFVHAEKFAKIGPAERFLESAHLVLLFISSYFASRLLSLLTEPSIKVEGEITSSGGDKWVSIHNTDGYEHPEVKVFFEVHKKINYTSGIRSSFLVTCSSVSLGSIPAGNGRNKPSVLRLKLPKEVLDTYKEAKIKSTSAEIVVKVTSVHRLTNARGLTSKSISILT